MKEEPHWEPEFARRRWPLMVGAIGRSLLSVRPTSGGRAYYRAIAAALVASTRRRTPIPIEQFVSGNIWVKHAGMEYLLNSESFFGYFLHAFEPRTAWDLLRRGGGVFIDCGANTGQYAVPLSRHFDTVVAVEPNPIAAAILRENLKRNRILNVEVVERLVSPRKGPARLYAGATLTTWGTHYVADRFVDVDAVTLDELIAPHPSVDLVKLDIEGQEGPTILSSRLLDRVRTLSYSVLPDDLAEVGEFLQSAGFSIRTPEPLFRSEENLVAERPFGAGRP